MKRRTWWLGAAALVAVAITRLGGCPIAAAADDPRGATRLLRFPDIWHDRIVFSYAGDLWTVAAGGGTASRLTAGPGLELFAKFSPDGAHLAFTAQYGGDEQVYVMPSQGGVPRQLTFYPAEGPLAERWGYDNQVYGWTPDGTAILFRSARDGYSMTESKLYTVPLDGGAATALPMPISGAGDFSPDGTHIVYSPLWRDFRSEKRYQGGWANDLYLFDLQHPALQRITDDPHTDRDPMWLNGAVYFNSDRSGVFNLYRYDLATRETRAITANTDWDVRWPSADADCIVYELHGALHVYDTRDSTDRAVSITVPTDGIVTRPQAVNAADDIESVTVSPGGERAAVVARGDVFSVPIDSGVTRNLTHSSNAHDREAAWSSDGKRLAYVSDRSGEEELYVQAQDGNSEGRRLTTGSAARYSAPRWSSDDARIAFADQRGQIHVIEVATQRSRIIAKDPAEPALDYVWSPDGQYLAYSLSDGHGFSAVYVWSVADGLTHRVTPLESDSQSPAWSPNGELLYFLSAREYQPIMSTIEFDYATDRQIGIFAVALTRDAKNPFAVRDDEPGDAAQAAADPAAAAAGHRRAASRSAKSRSAHTIDFDGIVTRVIRVPLEADNLSDLHVTDDSLVYQRSGPAYYGRESAIKPTVMAYSIKDREAKPVIEDVADWSLTADGKHVLAQTSAKELRYVALEKGDDAKGDDAKTGDGKLVSLAGLLTTRIPREEWREIFAEVWRRYRDFFYVANMHGYDWQALRQKYEPLVESVGHRVDLNYVIAEMISELVVQHAYIEGGDLGLPKRPFVALPGARFELDAASGRYRIAKIFAGQNEEEHYRSPLTEVGLDVHVGDYVLTMNGRELKAGTDPYELLQTPANQPVEWRIASTPDGKNSRTIRYRPLERETALLYLEWVRHNRAVVDDRSHGRLGYIHIPDMGEAGLREFIKGWYPQVRKEGLLVDIRHNGGGNVSQMLLERLGRNLQGVIFARNHDLADTYPRAVQTGPKAALINEDTASDGDIFAYQFRDRELGPLIGKRTWGGVVGITEHGPLLDGGMVFVPEFATASSQGAWIIEGRGVEPDIEVEEDPIAVMHGKDPQLERGIDDLLQRLPATPAGLPARPAPPVKTVPIGTP